VTYDSRNKITRATGNVEAVQAGRRVVADTVMYDEVRNVVTAEGNVTLYEPSSEVVSGKSIELSGDLKSGVVEDLHAILADGSRLTAARRVQGRHGHHRGRCNLHALPSLRRGSLAGAVMADSLGEGGA
jgi:LPS-assembly protein